MTATREEAEALLRDLLLGPSSSRHERDMHYTTRALAAAEARGRAAGLESAAVIAETQSVYPDTKIGTRQEWVKARIAERIRAMKDSAVESPPVANAAEQLQGLLNEAGLKPYVHKPGCDMKPPCDCSRIAHAGGEAARMAAELSSSMCLHDDTNAPPVGCIHCFAEKVAPALVAEYARGVEDAAKVADGKAREHVDLATQLRRTKQHSAAAAHERYASVCNGSDGIAARIRALISAGSL